MLYFSLAMLLFAIAASFRGPVLRRSSVIWFFISWLPGELPWLFAAIQITGTAILFLLSDTIGLKEMCSLFIAVVTFVLWFSLHLKTYLAGPVLQTALYEVLGEKYESKLPANIGISSPPVIQKREWLKPFSFKRKDIERLQNISYGTAERNRLDIYRKVDPSPEKLRRPVLLQIHGGAWMLGHKYQQAQPLMKYLAQNGWLCVDLNYRLAPKHPYPACVIDVKKAIVWIKENIASYGGDPDFIAITGESAGGHLCALTALTANQPEFQPGFETSDTRIQAAVPVYGVYDFTNHQRDGSVMRKFLEKYVMPETWSANPDYWKNASPLFRIGNTQLPMFVLHGNKDCVVPVQQAQDFVQALKQKNRAPVIYAEIPGAQHGYDVFHSVRTEFHIEAVGKFLHYCYAKRK